MTADEAKLEWRWPANSRKQHLFRLGEITSLCGRWMFNGEAQGEYDGTAAPSDCAECARRANRAKRR